MTMTVAALQYCANDDAAATLAHIEPLIAKAARTAGLICLPEAASFLAASRAQLSKCAEWEDDSVSQKKLAALARQHDVWLLAGSLFLRRRQDHKLVNRGILFAPDGQIIASYDKIHMFDANVGDGQQYCESNSFVAGTAPVIADLGDIQLGMSICYDLRFAYLYRQLARDGAHILTVPAAFTAVSGAAHWHVLLRARAIETGCYVIAPAQCGTHSDGRQTYGHALIISPWGEILAEADDGDGVITATIDLAKITAARRAIPSLASTVEFGKTKFYRR
uniref:Predicted amidohydrolase n=1 Tax=uncultured alpha proteobacterium HF0070_05I22 TaxID=710803 RepID=E0XX77_9PROT|nr:predicted amidohydrolase [uncultured alpha proteobacterium HF0070_05I22]